MDFKIDSLAPGITRETLSSDLVFPFFLSELAGLLVTWLSTTPPYFATRLYWSVAPL